MHLLECLPIIKLDTNKMNIIHLDDGHRIEIERRKGGILDFYSPSIKEILYRCNYLILENGQWIHKRISFKRSGDFDFNTSQYLFIEAKEETLYKIYGNFFLRKITPSFKEKLDLPLSKPLKDYYDIKLDNEIDYCLIKTGKIESKKEEYFPSDFEYTKMIEIWAPENQAELNSLLNMTIA